jgi:hypothetical protein
MAEPQQEPSDLYITVNDKSGNAVTIFSNTGELRSTADFANALKQHNAGKGSPTGFTIRPTGTGQEIAVRGLTSATRETLPQMGEDVGGAIGKAGSFLSPLLALGAKAGLIGRQQGTAPEAIGKTAGRATADFVGQQVDTPGEAGMAAGTAIGSLVGLPVVGASSELLKGNLLKNMLISGGFGTALSTIGKKAFGEDQTIGKMSQEFATAALSSGVQGIASYWLTRMLKPETATKVATEMMDVIKKKYPTLVDDPNAFAIANSTPKDISNLTSMMTKALRGDATDEAANFVATLKTTLPTTPTVAQQNTLRMFNRKVIEAQNEALDNIGDTVKFDKALPAIQEAKGELINYVRSIYPKVKNIDPAIVRVEEVLARQSDFVDTLKEGATVLHHLKQSGAADKFNPMEFAQRIRGEYTKEPGSLLNEVGNILGQGSSLKNLPTREQLKAPTPTGGALTATSIKDFFKQFIPGADMLSRAVKTNSTPTPWGVTPLTPANRTAGFAAQEAGQAAIRDFLKREE